MKEFIGKLDAQMRAKNIYYDDLISGNILQPLKIIPVRKTDLLIT